ncbi:MAG: MFS transporter [Acetobacteraceae bacterium]|nr:MFS transporter [Acetobacteraceae bacterium]
MMRDDRVTRRLVSAPGIVLVLLCLMYAITYVDRVNVGSAAPAIKAELGLSNTELGLVFSAFAYPYALLQIYGGWVSDRFGPRVTLFACGLVWVVATILTGLAGGVVSLFAARVLLGVGEGATFPGATRAMQSWITADRRGFAQGITHACARLGNAVTPPMVAWLTVLLTWRGSFIVLGAASFLWIAVWVWYYRDNPADHPGITQAELADLPPYVAKRAGAKIPWKRLTVRMLPVTVTYFCYGWTLWLYLNWLPSFFLHNYRMDIKSSAIFASGVFFAGVAGDTLGGVLTDRIYHRTGDLKKARRNVIVAGFVLSLICLLPVLFIHDLTIVAVALSAAFFFAELVIGPIWAIPMDIAPRYSGTAAGLMNTGSAIAAILSPTVFGVVIDLTGNWELPFIGSIFLLAVGAALAFTMHPEIPFETAPETSMRPAAAL